MYKTVRPLFLITETPLHAGSGQELGIVDLPIQRERHTGFPKIEASGLKGAIRDVFERKEDINKKDIELVFGPDDPGKNEAFAGAIGFSDARILLFPVKSVKGVFGWITCPMVLERFKKELSLSGIDFPELPNKNTIPSDSNLVVAGKVVLEEYTFNINEDPKASNVAKRLSELILPKDSNYGYLRNKMQKDIVILPNDDFTDFVELSTEVITRIKIDPETGVVSPGALFTEEFLPQETVMYTLAFFGPIFNKEKGSFGAENGKKEERKIIEFFSNNLPPIVQMGGDATIGKGLVRVNFKKEVQ